MNQYEPYSMTTDEKRRQLMEMYNLQFNPNPMQPPKPTRMAAPPAGAMMATPPAIAFARGPSGSTAQQISAPSASAPFAQQAVEEPLYAGGISGEEFGKIFAAAIKPNAQTDPQASYETYQAAAKRYNALAPSFERLGRFYGQIKDYAGSAIENELKLPFDQVFSEYIRQTSDFPSDLSKSFFDWYVIWKERSPITKNYRESKKAKEKKQLNTPVRYPANIANQYDRIRNMITQPGYGRMPPIRPTPPEGMK